MIARVNLVTICLLLTACGKSENNQSENNRDRLSRLQERQIELQLRSINNQEKLLMMQSELAAQADMNERLRVLEANRKEAEWLLRQ